MTGSEKIAEVIIRYAYNKGNSVSIREIIEKFGKKEYAQASDNMNTILLRYGDFESNTVERYYILNSDGIEFARKGCFSGAEKREKQTTFRANLSLGISILATLISLGAFIVTICK